jgi:hypothetical protein
LAINTPDQIRSDYVVQGHRYNVWEDLGPLAETYNVTLAFPITYIWEPLICAISAVFSIMTIQMFLARQKEFDAVLNCGASNINKDRYLRLLSLAAVGACIHLPLASWLIIINATVIHVSPWISWEDTHSNYHRIEYVDRFMLSTAPANNIYASVSWWSLVLCGINFFIFFGFGEDSTRQYKAVLGTCLKPFGIKYPKEHIRQTVIPCRPGRPNLTSFAKPSVSPFKSNPRPSGRTNNNKQPTTRSQTTSGESDMNFNVSDIDFLDPAETRKQARISSYTPGQPTLKRPASLDLSIHRASLEEKDITDEKILHNDEVSSPSSSTAPKVEFDLEAQEPSALTIEQQRRKEILEKNPELTEEVTF